MIVQYSSLENFELPQFTLCNPGSVYNNGLLTNVIGILIDHEAEEIVFNFNSTSELNLRVNRIIREDQSDNEYAYSIYKALQNKRLIYVENIGFFMISSVSDGYENGLYYKDITAKSIDVEIENKMIPYIPNATYRFSTDVTGVNKGILETIVETLPLWKIGHVDKSVAKKWRTFEDVDTSTNCLSFLIEKVQDAYECIVIFDIIERTINVYDQDNYIKQTDIHLTKDDLINSINITENAEDLYTAISVFGDDNTTISAINPLGSNVIYNFSYYTDWMSKKLGNKVKQWQEAVEDTFSDYYDKNKDYYEKLSNAEALNSEIEGLNTQIKMYGRCRNNIIAEASTARVSEYNTVIKESGGEEIGIGAEVEETKNNIDDLISNCESKKEGYLSELSNLNSEIKSAKLAIDKIQKALSLKKYFTSSELEELNNYIFEGEYNDEYVVITDSMTYNERFEQMKLLYDRSKSQLDKVSEPTQEFSIDVENFIFSKRFKAWSEQLETGCLINVELKANDIALLFLSSMSINYDDRSLSMTFGNRFNKFDPKSLFDNVLGNISKSANTLNFIKEILYPIKNGEFNKMKEALQISRNLSMGAALSSTNEEVIIDGSGYTGRHKLSDGEYDPNQIKITGKNIVFTDDAWESCKTAIGALFFGEDENDVVYGINAEAIIGNLIIGNGLNIVDDNGNSLLEVVDEKIESAINDEINGSLSELEQAAEELRISFKKLDEKGGIETEKGYTFDDDGLRISASDDKIQTVISNDGMVVSDTNGNEILTANDDGVNAMDLTARQYLIIGTNSRFEDYSDGTDANRTACFYIGK